MTYDEDDDEEKLEVLRLLRRHCPEDCDKYMSGVENLKPEAEKRELKKLLLDEFSGPATEQQTKRLKQLLKRRTGVKPYGAP